MPRPSRHRGRVESGSPLRRLQSEADISQAYEEYANTIYRYCFRATANFAVAEDLTATVFLEAWRCRSSVVLDSDAGILPWLYGVARNVVRSFQRGEQRRLRREMGPAEIVDVADLADEMASRVDDERVMSAALAALKALGDTDQEIIRLCVWEGLPPRQAAIALGIDAPAARARLSRALRHLRANVDAPEIPHE